jgi:hypothetical protein
MTSRVLAILALSTSLVSASWIDITKLPPMDNYGWKRVIELRGRHLEALDTALHQFRADHFSTSGDLKRFTITVQQRGDIIAIAFAPDYHEASSKGLPGRNKFGTYITYFVSLRTLKLVGFHFERD